MIDETVAKIDAALREARAAGPKNKTELIATLETLRADLLSDKRSKSALDAASENLEGAAVEFKATHPQLAAVVGEVTTLLASIGV